MQDALKKLPVEAKRQASHVETTERKLKRVRDIMKMTAVVSSRSPREMLQSCVIPRLLMSPEDAIFCAYFFLRMHDLDMPGFPTCYAINEVPVLHANIYLAVLPSGFFARVVSTAGLLMLTCRVLGVMGAPLMYCLCRCWHVTQLA